MLEESNYEHLAEFYLNFNESPLSDYVYCLCSRVIIRGDHFEDEKLNQEYFEKGTTEEENNIKFFNSSTESHPPALSTKKREHDDGVSCYCSASHCSTDDSTRDAPHSDSGADLSETSRDPEWESYWAKHGERIIWESWIQRYGDYMDPNYLKQDADQRALGNLDCLTEVIQENESSEVTRLSYSSEISDSLTNVTPLTLSELSAEDSSLLSSSDSAGSVSADAAQWQMLWIDHFNTQYNIAYQHYLAGVNVYPANDWIPQIQEEQPQCSLRKKARSERNQREQLLVRHLLDDLKSMNMEKNENDNINDGSSKDEEPLEVSSKSTTDLAHFDSSSTITSHCFKMTDIISNGSSEAVSSKKENIDRLKLKRRNDTEEDRLRSAFDLIGMAYSGEGVSSGSVIFKKRNIRWQNRALNFGNRFDYFKQPAFTDTKKKETKVEDIVEVWHLADSGEIKSDFSEKDDSSSGEFFSASEEGEISKREKRKRKKKRKGLPKEMLENERLLKYWYKRYRLFSRFDEGIKLDEESWYSVTPEKVSSHTAERCRCDVMIDACCGAGGNTIQFAFTCERVIAIDIDPQKIHLARHNAKVYGVEDRIEFIVGDFLKLAPTLQADVVFLSPPWGGLDYACQPTYSLDRIMTPIGGKALYASAVSITPNVAMYLPRNVNTDELLKMAGSGSSIELEQNFLGKKLIAVTVYFGELIKSYNMDAE